MDYSTEGSSTKDFNSLIYSSMTLDEVLDNNEDTTPTKGAPTLSNLVDTSAMETTTMQDYCTPPPEPQDVNSPVSHDSATSLTNSTHSEDAFLRGSSLEESPLSSPEHSRCSGKPSIAIKGEGSPNGAAEGVSSRGGSGSWDTSDEEVEDGEKMAVPKNVKLPQRKGGMQLWQFLYALLTDPNKQFSDLIEWTSNVKAREFRLLEPESIAIWWGEHKNKKNMSYDKLSRSLRYYYDKGIIRKIPGERYVYQFCIDPELMYKHIGNSDCRPKLKPMPQSAIQATSKFQMQHGYSSLPQKDSIFIAQGPVSLSVLSRGGSSFPGDIPFMSPHHTHHCGGLGYPPAFAYENSPPYCQPAPMLEISGQTGFHSPFEGMGRPHNLTSVRRCRSFESPLDNQFYIPEQEMAFNNHFLSMGANMAINQAAPLSVNHPHPQQHSPIISPPSPPVSGDLTSPLGSSISGTSPIASGSLNLDDIIEFTTSDAFSTQNTMVYTNCGVSNSAALYSTPSVVSSDNATTSLWSFN